MTGVEDWRGTVFQNHLAIEAAEAGQGFALSDQILCTDALLEGWLVRPFNFDMRDHWHYWIVRGKGMKETVTGTGLPRMADERNRGYQQEICATDRPALAGRCGKARDRLAFRRHFYGFETDAPQEIRLLEVPRLLLLLPGDRSEGPRRAFGSPSISA